MDRDNNKGLQFAEFILSVIKQKCAMQKKPFFTEYSLRKEHENYLYEENIFYGKERYESVPRLYRYDGYAPMGFDDFTRPVIVEVKYNPRNIVFKPLGEPDKETVTLYVISTSEEKIQKRKIGENVYVWGLEAIAEWERKFPIDFYSFYTEKFNLVEEASEIIDFKTKNDSNRELLKKEIQSRIISLSLGAGVSIDYGAKKWSDLINDFYNEIHRLGKIDDAQAVQNKIGGTSLINGQFAQDNLLDFMHSLYKGLYGKYNGNPSYYTNTTLACVAELAKKLCVQKRFNIISYNYDDYLEQIFNRNNIAYNSLYNEEGKIDDRINIFHPHGFLPYGTSRGDYPVYKNFIVFSESEYHKLYNNPLSWAMVLQEYLYRGSAYLFVGSSLTDPNLRRILENTKIKGKTHYALMLTDGLSKKDQFIVHRHFMRIGVECIWFDSVDDMKTELKSLSKI